MRLVDALTNLGTTAGASTLSTLPAQICSTALESVQRLSFTGRKDVFNDLPPIVLDETGLLNQIQLWGSGTHPLSNGYRSGPGIPSRESVCIGGVIVQLDDNTWKPAAVLHSHDLITLFVSNCELSVLEQSIETTTPSQMENHIFGAAMAEQTRRLLPKLMQFTRTAGASAMSPHLCSIVHLVRDGPLPWLRVRSPATSEEKTELHVFLSKFPVANPKTATALLGKNEETTYRLQTILSKAKLALLPNPLVTTAVELIDAAIIAPLALILLGQTKRTNKLLEATESCSIDSTNEDADGTPQIGSFYAVQKQALSLAKQEEEEAVKIVADVPKLTPAEAITASSAATMAIRPSPPPVEVTLSEIANAVKRKFAVKQVANSFCVNGIEQLVKEVTRSHDSNMLRQMLDNLPRTTAAFDSLHQIIKICDKRYAFLITSVQGIHLFTPNERYTIDADAAARLLLCPWITPIVFNMGAVGVITVDGVVRWPLTLDDGVRVSRLALNKQLPGEVSRAMQATATSGEKIETLADRLVQLETNLASQMAAVSAATALNTAEHASIQPTTNLPDRTVLGQHTGLSKSLGGPEAHSTPPNPNLKPVVPPKSSTASTASIDIETDSAETQSHKRSSEEVARAVTRRKMDSETTASWKVLSVRA
jgi:hypothetical protein